MALVGVPVGQLHVVVVDPHKVACWVCQIFLVRGPIHMDDCSRVANLVVEEVSMIAPASGGSHCMSVVSPSFSIIEFGVGMKDSVAMTSSLSPNTTWTCSWLWVE